MPDKANSSIGQSSDGRAQQSAEAAHVGGSPQSAGRGSPYAASDAASSTAATMDKAKETLSKAASHAGEKVTSRLDTQKDKAADGLGSVARALRQTGDQLRDEDQVSAVHGYIASAADQVERLSGYLRSTNARDVVRGVEQFARQQPALFVGAAFMLGVLGARFLKSSGSGRSGFAQSASERSAGFAPRVSSGETRTTERGYSGAEGTAADEFDGAADDYPPPAMPPARGRGY